MIKIVFLVYVLPVILSWVVVRKLMIDGIISKHNLKIAIVPFLPFINMIFVIAGSITILWTIIEKVGENTDKDKVIKTLYKLED